MHRSLEERKVVVAGTKGFAGCSWGLLLVMAQVCTYFPCFEKDYFVFGNSYFRKLGGRIYILEWLPRKIVKTHRTFSPKKGSGIQKTSHSWKPLWTKEVSIYILHLHSSYHPFKSLSHSLILIISALQERSGLGAQDGAALTPKESQFLVKKTSRLTSQYCLGLF